MSDNAHLQWRVVGASVTGSSHQAIGRGCDDAHLYAILPGNNLFLAVADGAGSAAHAAEGAQKAVQVAVEMAQKLFDPAKFASENLWWHSYLNLILGQVRVVLQDTAAQAQLELRDFATTLLLAVVSDTMVATAQVGDGAIVVQNNPEDLTTVSAPPQIEHLNETVFITADDYLAQSHLQALPFKSGQNLALLTDGLQMLALNLVDNKAHAPFFGPLFKFAANRNLSTEILSKQLVAFLDSDRVNSVTDDDKTLLLAVRV